MQLATFSPPASSRAPQPHPVAEVLRGVVRLSAQLAPRSQQRAPGPSQIGEPCDRKLTYAIMGQPPSNLDADPWAAIVGTATHAWLAEAFTLANTMLGRTRFLVEQRLEIVPGLVGSCDLYDVDIGGTVIDHKVLGPTSMSAYRRHGPPDQYRVQAHLYGMGYARLGLPVAEVALAFYPRSGLLGGLWVWSEPYSPAVALAALDRYWRLIERAVDLDVEHHPERYRELERAPGHRCTYCPWFQPGPDIGVTCPGHLGN